MVEFTDEELMALKNLTGQLSVGALENLFRKRHHDADVKKLSDILIRIYDKLKDIEEERIVDTVIRSEKDFQEMLSIHTCWKCGRGFLWDEELTEEDLKELKEDWSDEPN